jgi:hypothetical protein
MSLRSSQRLTRIVVTGTVLPTFVTSSQLRYTSNNLPKHLKGKLYWKRRDLRGKKDPDREKKERDKRELREYTSKFHWTPETGNFVVI